MSGGLAASAHAAHRSTHAAPPPPTRSFTTAPSASAPAPTPLPPKTESCMTTSAWRWVAGARGLAAVAGRAAVVGLAAGPEAWGLGGMVWGAHCGDGPGPPSVR